MCWVKKFSDVPECTEFFLNGSTPNLPGILVGGTVQNQGQNQNRYKPICQKFNNIYRFATLYDTFNKIPVFSAYTFTGPPTGPRRAKRPKEQKEKSISRHWKIEPQLEDENINIEEMNFQSGVKEMLNNNKVLVNQAVNTDYVKSGLHKGHLFPCSHAPDDDTKRSTCTLTNAVPQNQNFNQGRWKAMEGNVRETLVENCKNNNNKIEAYVVTGAVPNNNNNQLNHRVNIPDLMWTAFCCENNLGQWVAGAHWGENQKEDQKKTLPSYTLAELYDKLNERYGDGVQLFPDQCLRDDIPTELLLKDGGDEQDHCDYVPTEEPLIKNTCPCPPRKRVCNPGDVGGGVKRMKFQKRDIPTELLLKDGGDGHDHCVYDDDCVCSSVGVKGYYLPVVFVSVLVMMM
ncbi:endonuclease domain-containing 1 protein-like isoform X2 [Salvelinus alpinus]|uniref:endonuclease domain-containing 1 protein-like isoform X2 n=1 Tax=Salvelinus alpinus TaxID=8036 RepID=UPI0039FD0749